MRRTADLLLSRPGTAHAVTFAGFDGATFTNAPNTGVIFVTLKPFEERMRAEEPSLVEARRKPAPFALARPSASTLEASAALRWAGDVT